MRRPECAHGPVKAAAVNTFKDLMLEELAVGNVFKFKQRAVRSAPVALAEHLIAQEQTRADALNIFAKAQCSPAAEHLETALAAAENICARLPSGSAKSQFELERDRLVEKPNQLREQIRTL